MYRAKIVYSKHKQAILFYNGIRYTHLLLQSKCKQHRMLFIKEYF